MIGPHRWVLGPIIELVGEDLPKHLTGVTIIVGDPSHWVQNAAELEADLQELGGERRGMVLWFPDVETRTLWLLRWS